MSRTLVIESRDCITSPGDYRIVVSSTDTPYTELLNKSFSPTIEHDVGGLVAPGSQYAIRVELVERSTGTTIDGKSYTISNTTTTEPPPVTGEQTVRCDGVLIAVQPTTETEADYTVVVVCVAGGVIIGLMIGAVGTVFLMVSLIRKKSNREGPVVGVLPPRMI